MTSWIFPASNGDVDGQTVPSDFLSITLEMRGASTVVVLDGVVCAFTSSHLDAELHKIEALDRHRLVIDAHAVRTMSSDGLAVLVDHAERCARAGGELVVRGPSPVTRRVLSVCHLERLIDPSDPMLAS